MGIHPPKRLSAIQRHVQIRLFNLKLHGGQIERKATLRFEMSGSPRNPTPTSMLAGRVLYGFYGLFASVLRIARRIVYSPFYLVNLAFGFKFLVARHVPGNFLSFTDGVTVAPLTCSLSICHLC